MVHLRWFDDFQQYFEADVIEVEASDFNSLYDERVASIQTCEGGYWEVFHSEDGSLCAYYDEPNEEL